MLPCREMRNIQRHREYWKDIENNGETLREIKYPEIS